MVGSRQRLSSKGYSRRSWRLFVAERPFRSRAQVFFPQVIAGVPPLLAKPAVATNTRRVRRLGLSHQHCVAMPRERIRRLVREPSHGHIQRDGRSRLEPHLKELPVDFEDFLYRLSLHHAAILHRVEN